MPDLHQPNIPTDREVAAKAWTLIVSDLSRVWPVPVLATECGVTAYTLKRIFKHEYGCSITAFSLAMRMEKAKALLITTNNTLQMIAEAVGYTEGNNFQQAFKRVVGYTPGEWRRYHNS